MKSGRRLGGDWCPRWLPGAKSRTSFGQNCSIWAPFGEPFSLKNRFCRHRFLHQISEGIFRGFWWILELIFMTLASKNRIRSGKSENMKNLVLLKENLCFRRSRALFFGLKIDKNGVGTRCGIGTDFFMIFDGFGPPFWAPKSRKSIKETMWKTNKN